MKRLTVAMWIMTLWISLTSISGSIPERDISTRALLILDGAGDDDPFSIFEVLQTSDGTLIAINLDSETYPVEGGEYEIIGTSDNVFLGQRIIVLNFESTWPMMP